MKPEEKHDHLQSLFVILKPCLIILVIGFIYLNIFQKIGIGIPCIFYQLTGYQCPGCGMTRAMSEIWKGNLYRAWEYNALSITVFPIICIYFFYRSIKEKRESTKGFSAVEYIFLVVLLGIVLGYGYFRNKL